MAYLCMHFPAIAWSSAETSNYLGIDLYQSECKSIRQLPRPEYLQPNSHFRPLPGVMRVRHLRMLSWIYAARFIFTRFLTRKSRDITFASYFLSINQFWRSARSSARYNADHRSPHPSVIGASSALHIYCTLKGLLLVSRTLKFMH